MLQSDENPKEQESFSVTGESNNPTQKFGSNCFQGSVWVWTHERLMVVCCAAGLAQWTSVCRWLAEQHRSLWLRGCLLMNDSFFGSFVLDEWVKAKVGRTEKRMDLAWKFERVQLSGPSPLTLVLISKAPPHSVARPNSLFLACFSSLVFLCLLVFVMLAVVGNGGMGRFLIAWLFGVCLSAIASAHWRHWAWPIHGEGSCLQRVQEQWLTLHQTLLLALIGCSDSGVVDSC